MVQLKKSEISFEKVACSMHLGNVRRLRCALMIWRRVRGFSHELSQPCPQLRNDQIPRDIHLWVQITFHLFSYEDLTSMKLSCFQ